MKHEEHAAMMSEGLLTITEAAEFLRQSRATLYTLMRRGEIPYVTIGRTRRIPRATLVSFAVRNVARHGSDLEVENRDGETPSLW